MRKSYKYLKDETFLKEFDRMPLQEEYVKLILLNWEEYPIQEIQGLVTGGTINIDGKSSVRRTCNISVFLAQDDYERIGDIDNLISINKKLCVEIGFLNMTNQYQEYEKLWFPQGIFVITSCSVNHAINGVTISLQLKDKMCLLNGDCGGVITASTEFHKYDTVDENGSWVVERPVISQIIRELVNHIGGEQLSKIIISDIDDRIKQVMRWIGNSPIYLYKQGDSYFFKTNYNDIPSDASEKHTYTYSDDVGFIYTDFTYPGELIGNAGDTVCTILDKIKSTLGNYEYFYDIDGNFVFQEVKNYINTSKATMDLKNLKSSDYVVDISKGKTVYQFDDATLIASYQNSPQYNMIKNDFVVWGSRTNSNGNKVPIRYHLAIDTKPTIGNIYSCFRYEDPEDGLIKYKRPVKFNNYASFPRQGEATTFYLDNSTGFIYRWEGKEKKYIKIENAEMVNIQTNDWRSELYLQGVNAQPTGLNYGYYSAELTNEWPKLYDLQASNYERINSTTGSTTGVVYLGAYKQDILKHQSNIDYYLDFIDDTSGFGKFSISNIGRRTKVVTNNNINCIFESEIPDLVIIESGSSNAISDRDECISRYQNYTQVDSAVYKTLATGGYLNSAYEEVKNLLYQHLSYNETITLQIHPIYHLEPNTRIRVQDQKSDIFGDYMISAISIPLDINGTSSITAMRALEKV